MPNVLVFNMPNVLVFNMPNVLVFNMPNVLVFNMLNVLVFNMPNVLVFNTPNGQSGNSYTVKRMACDMGASLGEGWTGELQFPPQRRATLVCCSAGRS